MKLSVKQFVVELAFFAVFPVAAALSVGCGRTDVRMALNEIESKIQDSPSEAFDRLRAIDTASLGTSRLRADYSLLMAMALDKNWVDTTDVEVIRPALEFYARHKPLSKRAWTYYYLGVIQFNGRNYPDACVSMLRSWRYAYTLEDEGQMSFICSALASIFSNTFFYDEALKYDVLSRDYSSKIGDSLGVVVSDYAIARDYKNLGRTEESDSLFKRLLSSAALSPRIRKAAILDHAVLMASEMEDFESAVESFERVISEFGSLPDEVSWAAYAYSLLRVGRDGDSDRIFEDLVFMDSEESLSFKKWKAMADAYKKDFKSAYDWLDLETDIQSKNFMKALRQSVITAQRDYFEKEAEKAFRKSIRTKGYAWATIALFLAMTIGLFYFWKRRNRRLIAERESLFELHRLLSDRLVRSEEERDEIRKRYIGICKANFNYLGRINEMLVTSKDKDSRLYRMLKRTFQDLQEDERSQKEFEDVLNASLGDVMSHFRQAFPGRRLRFYRFASFVFAGFDAATISVLIDDLSKDNVYVEKSRLKSRIQASSSPYKDEFLFLF